MSKQKLTLFLRPVALILIFLVFSSLLFFTLVKAQFVGPTGSAGSAPGAIGVDASKNLSVGTSTTQTNTKFLIVSSSTDSSNFGLKILQSNANPAFVVRNDGGVGIGTSTPNSATLTVNGTIYSSGNYTGTINAPNVSAGVFGAGNFAFPSSLGIATSSQVSLPQSLSVYGGGYFSGNVGIGTTGPGSTLDVNGNITDRADLVFSVTNSTIYTSATNGNLNVRSANSGSLNFQNSAGGDVNFYGGTGSILNVIKATTGNVGIGTTGPGAKLDVAVNVGNAGPHFRVLNTDAVFGGGFRVTGNNAQGELDMLNASGTVTGSLINTTGGWQWNTQLNIMNGNVGIGLTSPGQKLEVAGNVSSTAVCLSGTCNTSWPVSSSGSVSTSSAITAGYFPYWANTTGGLNGTSTIYQSGGNVGIATSSPQALLSVGNNTTGLVAVFGGGTGKITAGTFDPLYNINGEKFATYLPGMTGQKEETAGVINLTTSQVVNGACDGKTLCAVLDFKNAEKGSDLWLFSKVTNLRDNFDKLVALLTPSFDGRVWYEKDMAAMTLTIFGTLNVPEGHSMSKTLEVSYRLSAPRFDSASWPNVSLDGGAGFIINEK